MSVKMEASVLEPGWAVNQDCRQRRKGGPIMQGPRAPVSKSGQGSFADMQPPAAGSISCMKVRAWCVQII